MRNRYYVIQDGRQFGPLSIMELSKFKFQPRNLIWVNGLSDWLAVANMQDLCNKIEIAKNELEELNLRLQNTKYNNTNNHEAILSGAKNITFSGYKLASPARRFLASILNWFISLVLVFIFLPKPSGGIFLLLLCTLSAISYFFWSGNIGHKLLKLKVIKADNEEDCKNPMIGFLREAVKLLCYWLIFPNIWLLFDEKNQNLYDKIFKTYVIEKVKDNQLY